MLTFGLLAVLGAFGGPPEAPQLDAPFLPPVTVAVAAPALRPTLPGGGGPSTGALAPVLEPALSAAGTTPSILVAVRILEKYRDFRDALRAP